MQLHAATCSCTPQHAVARRNMQLHAATCSCTPQHAVAPRNMKLHLQCQLQCHLSMKCLLGMSSGRGIKVGLEIILTILSIGFHIQEGTLEFWQGLAAANCFTHAKDWRGGVGWKVYLRLHMAIHSFSHLRMHQIQPSKTYGLQNRWCKRHQTKNTGKTFNN
jgi:hypothetical protein